MSPWAGFTIKDAQFEGVLVVSANDVTIRDNTIEDNDQSSAVFDPTANHGCAGQPAFETDETGDCGGGLHLIGVWNSTVTGNKITRNDDGILISDETAESRHVLVYHNSVTDNPGECGIVLAFAFPRGIQPAGLRASLWHRPHYRFREPGQRKRRHRGWSRNRHLF